MKLHNTLDNIARLMRVTVPNAVAYFIISSALIISQLANIFISTVSMDPSTRTFSEVISDQFDEYLDLIQHNEIVALGLMFLIMSLVGSLVFRITRLTFNLLEGMFEHVNVSVHYELPYGFNRGRYWVEFIISIALHLVFIAALVTYTVFWLNIILPTVRILFDLYIGGEGSLIEVILAGLFLMVSLHIFVVLYRAVFSRFSE